MTPPPFTATLRAAEAHLSAACPRLAPVVARVGPCTLEQSTDLFRSVVRAVIAQLISTAAAKTISGRVAALVKNKLTPANMLAVTDDQWTLCGVSGGKRRAIRAAAELFAATRGLNAKLLKATDDEVRDLLLPLPGIGPWTLDMLMMFSLGRPDVLPVGDLGIRAGVKDLFKLKALPDAAKLTKLAAPWRPYRTVACWYVWRTRGWVPQSGDEE
jgi:DNA-3-methyladenine glycosylase II